MCLARLAERGIVGMAAPTGRFAVGYTDFEFSESPAESKAASDLDAKKVMPGFRALRAYRTDPII